MQQTRTVLQRDGPDHLAIIYSLPLTARAGGSEGSGGASGRPAVGPVLSGLALQKRLLRAGTMQVALHWQLWLRPGGSIVHTANVDFPLT